MKKIALFLAAAAVGAVAFAQVVGDPVLTTDPNVKQVEVVNFPETQNVSGTVEVSNLSSAPPHLVLQVPVSLAPCPPGSDMRYVSESFESAGWSWMNLIVQLVDGSALAPEGRVQYRHFPGDGFPTDLLGRDNVGETIRPVTSVRGAEARMVSVCSAAIPSSAAPEYLAVYLTR